VISIINDRPDIAILAGADGVHVGQTDLPAGEVRKVIGREMILGVSTQCMEHARQAVLDGADYIGVGPMFRSTTKSRDVLPGVAYARQVTESIHIPAVAIAGITEGNVDEVLATGIRAIAVTAAVASSEDPRGAAERLKAKVMKRNGDTGDLGRVSTPASRSPVADRNVCPTVWSTPAAPVSRGRQECLPHRDL
jgi:thiamine-phosphate pyrophosphorylase